MEMHIWNGLIVLSKVLFYSGYACLAGYAFLRREPMFKSGVTKLIIVAFIANIVWFIANSGAMAEDGLSGAFDSGILSIMMYSPIGSSAALRGIGLFIGFLAIIKGPENTNSKNTSWLHSCTMALALILLSYSFTLIGHVSELDYLAKLSLMTHAFVMAWWFGSLPPLAIACKTLESEKLQGLMERFGDQATFFVILLLAAGLHLALLLNSDLNGLLYTDHGRVLLLKLAFVLTILSIAAHHKLRLVPQLSHRLGRERLSRSINIEMGIACIVLLLTSILTSVVSPD